MWFQDRCYVLLTSDPMIMGILEPLEVSLPSGGWVAQEDLNVPIYNVLVAFYCGTLKGSQFSS